MQQVAKTPAQYEAALCLWPKLLALAGARKSEYRGWVLTERQEPASVQDLALFTGIRPKTIKSGLELLSHPNVNLIEERSYPTDSAENCESPQNSANPLLDDTDTDTDTSTETKNTTETPNGQPLGNGSEQGTLRQGAADGGSPTCLSPRGFAQTLALRLSLSPHREQQLQDDLACFQRFVENHLLPGHLGTPEEAADRCYRKAKEIANSPTVRTENRAKVWVSWAKRELQRQGHQWGRPG